MGAVASAEIKTNLLEGSVAGASSVADASLSTNLIEGSAAGTSTVEGEAIVTFVRVERLQSRGPQSHALPVLYLTTGQILNGRTLKFDLMNRWTGYYLDDWKPAIAQYKNNGVWSDSALSQGRKPVSYVYGNVVESIAVKARASDMNDLIEYTQELMKWLKMAADYWVYRGKIARPVYLVARAAYERNTRYALVYDGHIPELENPYAQPFSGQQNSIYDQLTILLERGHWQDVPPGDSTCVPLSNSKVWTFEQWDKVASPPTGQVNTLVQAADGALLAGMNSNGQIYASTDNGATWSLLATLTGATSSTAVQKIILGPNNVLYAAVTGDNTVRGVWNSSDHGATWNRILNPTMFSGDSSTAAGYYGLFYDQPRGRILASGGGVSSTEGGLSVGIVSRYNISTNSWDHWEKSPYNYFKAVVTDIHGRVYTGWNGGTDKGIILRSRSEWFVLEPQPLTWTPVDAYAEGWGPSAWFRAEDTVAFGHNNPVSFWPTSNSPFYRAIAFPGQEPIHIANALNGYPVLRFDHTKPAFMDTNIAPYPTLNLGSSTWCVIALVRESKDDGGSVTVWGETGTSANDGRYYLEMRRAATDMYLNTNFHRLNANVSWSIDTWQILSAQFTAFGPSRRLYRNGQLIGSDNYLTPVNTPVGEGIRIGGRGGGLLAFDGDIAEILIFRFDLSDDRRARIENYLNTKYGLGQTMSDYEVVSGRSVPLDDMIRLGEDILYTTQVSGLDQSYVSRLFSPNYLVYQGTSVTTSKRYKTLYADPVSPNRVWAGANATIYKSENKGSSWSVVPSAASTDIKAILRTETGTLIAGGNSEVVTLEGGGTLPTTEKSTLVGFLPTCDPVPVTSQTLQSNITDAWSFDASASTYTRVYPAGTYPVALLPDPPAVGDILYVGAQTDLTETKVSPFNTLAFDIWAEKVGVGLTVLWEYWDGSSWASLSAQDQTQNFSRSGVRTVNWSVPSDWATTTVNSITGWWVRGRVTAVSAPQAPYQVNRDIQCITEAFVEVPRDEIRGELPAITRIQWENVSVNAVDRILVGLRSFDDESRFQAYLNISDIQVPFGVTITKHASASWADTKSGSTGRALQVSFSSDLSQWYDLVTFSLSNTIARDYYGTFRVFLRCHQSSGDADDWRVRVAMLYGSTGHTIYSKDPFIVSTLDGYVADLGSLTIPVAAVTGITENLPDALKLVVQGFPVTSSITLTLYDLILIPLDEWAADVINPSAVGVSAPDSTMSLGVEDILDIDSRELQHSTITAVKRNSGGFIECIYQVVSGGPGILQAGKTQRLFFLPMIRSTGTNFPWLSFPSMAGKILIDKVQRYLSARGRR